MPGFDGQQAYDWTFTSVFYSAGHFTPDPAPPLSPARGPPTDWAELVHVYDDRNVFQAAPDALPVIDIHSLGLLPDARHQRAARRPDSERVCVDP